MVIPLEHKQTFIDFFTSVYSNSNAVNLSMMLIEVAHIWDDLIDKDNPVSDDDINLAFRYLIYDIPINPIYRAIPSLPDHMLNVYLRWRDATVMERNNPTDHDLEKCFMLRAGIYDIFAIIAFYIAGDEASKAIGPSIRRLYGETMAELKKEFNHA